MSHSELDETLRLSRDQMKQLRYQVVDRLVEHLETPPAKSVVRFHWGMSKKSEGVGD